MKRRNRKSTRTLLVGAPFYYDEITGQEYSVIAQGNDVYAWRARDYDATGIDDHRDVWVDAPLTVGSFAVGERFCWSKDTYRVTAVGVRTSLVVRETGKDAQFELALLHDFEVQEVPDGE